MLTELLQELIRIPSENDGSTGHENDVQRFYFNWLERRGIKARLVYPEELAGFDTAPGRLLEHSMHNRPVVTASLTGKRPGRKLLLIAHADTVPAGDPALWSDSPFSGKLESGRIYGRGAGDDKWGMSVMANLLLELKGSGCDFPGEVIIASVPDEEAGGGNGTIALFHMGIEADECIYLDGGSNQSIWHAGLGGGFCRIRGGDREKIRRTVMELKREIKARLDAHPCFGPGFFPIIEKQFYGFSVKDDACSFFHDTLPGDDEEALKRQFEARLPGCRFQWMSRFLKPALVPRESALVRGLADSFRRATGREIPVTGGLQSDQGLVMSCGGIPCILFGCGRRGVPGAAHMPDEFVETAKLEEIFRTLLLYVRCEESPEI